MIKTKFRTPAGLILSFAAIVAVNLGPWPSVHASPAQPATKETVKMNHAIGTFEVKLTPHASDTPTGEPVVGRMTIDKQFKGDLEAKSNGQMLAIRTEVKDSAGYVAMERVIGALSGKTGSFALQHSGTMARGVPSLSVTVVPDSGTGDLKGIAGRMTIDLSGGRHSYTFDYTFPSP